MGERTIDLSPLKFDDRGRTLWKECIGTRLNFEYDGIKSHIVIDEVVDSRKIKISGEHNKNYEIKKADVKTCSLARFLKINTREYLYNVGDVVNGLKILDKIRVKKAKYSDKGYIVECVKDGYTYSTYESNFKKGIGCGLCNGKVCVSGVNDVLTVRPDLEKYFVNKEDATTNTIFSHNKVDLVCVDCNRVKSMAISTFVYYGLGCSCNDKNSYANKFITNLLTQLTAYFESEKIFAWASIENNNIKKLNGIKIYDHYLRDVDAIIENHGMQHFENINWRKNGGRTFEEEQENDKLKRKLAIENNIKHYVELDCRKSELEWIKNSVMNSELPKLLVFKEEDIDWLECEKFALSNLVKEACDLWMTRKFKNTKELADEMKLSTTTIVRYLKLGNTHNWCDYTPEMHCKKYISKYVKDIEIIKEGVVLGTFKTPSDISKISITEYGVFLNSSKIALVCRGENKSHKGFTFRYVD